MVRREGELRFGDAFERERERGCRHEGGDGELAEGLEGSLHRQYRNRRVAL